MPMKHHRFFPLPFAAALLMAAFFAPLAATAADQAAPPALQIAVDVPPTWRPFLEDDIADALYSRIAETFRHGGFKGETALLDRSDKPAPGVPFLQITLMEWRINRIGNVDCTFSASITTGGKETNLGLFNGTSMQWISGPDRRWALQRGLDDSAASAIKDLYRKLTDQGLLPRG